MSAELAQRLHARLEWEAKADTVLALGTSLAGMNADRLATAAAERHQKSTWLAMLKADLSDMRTENMSTWKSDSCGSLR